MGVRAQVRLPRLVLVCLGSLLPSVLPCAWPWLHAWGRLLGHPLGPVPVPNDLSWWLCDVALVAATHGAIERPA